MGDLMTTLSNIMLRYRKHPFELNKIVKRTLPE